jgi:hypothetical protein
MKKQLVHHEFSMLPNPNVFSRTLARMDEKIMVALLSIM